MKRCLFLVSFLIYLQGSKAQDIYNLNFEKINQEGLSNKIIRCINQDKNGFLWFGTEEGLFRYDGYSFSALRNFPGDKTTLPNNIISALYPEGNNLWVLTREGFCCVDINSLSVKNFPTPGFYNCHAL